MMKMKAIKSLQTAAFVVAVALLAESSASADIPAEDNDYYLFKQDILDGQNPPCCPFSGASRQLV